MGEVAISTEYMTVVLYLRRRDRVIYLLKMGYGAISAEDGTGYSIY